MFLNATFFTKQQSDRGWGTRHIFLGRNKPWTLIKRTIQTFHKQYIVSCRDSYRLNPLAGVVITYGQLIRTCMPHDTPPANCQGNCRVDCVIMAISLTVFLDTVQYLLLIQFDISQSTTFFQYEMSFQPSSTGYDHSAALSAYFFRIVTKQVLSIFSLFFFWYQPPFINRELTPSASKPYKTLKRTPTK